MNSWVGSLNMLAGIAYPIAIILAGALVYNIFWEKEQSGCLGLSKDSSSDGEFVKAIRMGLIVLFASSFFTCLFWWSIGEPGTGTCVAAYVLIILAMLLYPEEVAEFSGDAMNVIFNLFGGKSRKG